MLHYITYEHDTSDQWITFIHGAGGSSSIWFRQLRAYRKEFNLLLIDLRGHGKSKNIKFKDLKQYHFDTIGDEILEVLDHLSVKSTHFIGVSLGTIVIREITERFPERVDSMILGGAIMKMNFRGQLLMRLGMIFKSVVPYLILYRFFAFVMMPKRNHKESRNLFINEAKKLYQKEFIRWFTLTSTVNPLLRFFRDTDSGCPTLYIMGEEDHMFLPSIRKLAASHKSSVLHIVPDSGHVVNVDKPDEFNRVTIDFIKSLA